MHRYRILSTMNQVSVKTPNRLLPRHPAEVLCDVKASKVKDTLTRLWDCPYPADPLFEPDFVGLTFGQVASLRQVMDAAQGNASAFERVLDRIIGKPVQQNTNINLGGSYKDFLLEIAKSEGMISDEDGVIDAQYSATGRTAQEDEQEIR